MTLDVILWAVFAFVCGSIPFALWIGYVGLGVDIRDYGDGNPGTFNVFRAGGGLTWGGLALMLDVSKGAAPVGGAAYIWNIEGWPLVLIAIAPILGHAFSPLLGFNGGKAIATTSGVLIGLSLVELPLVALPLLLFWYTSLTSSGWAVMLTAGGTLIYTLITQSTVEWQVTLVLILILLAYKHRDELRHLPRFKVPQYLRPFIKHLEPQSHAGDSIHNSRADLH